MNLEKSEHNLQETTKGDINIYSKIQEAWLQSSFKWPWLRTQADNNENVKAPVLDNQQVE